MAMTINTNIQSLNAQRNLGTSQSSLATSMQRLSSGMRINSAKDDAAGLAIATRMGTQITGLNQAARNANDGVSLAQTAEGALSSIGTNLQRIRELAVQSRNATNSTEDRSALQKEVDQLKSEIDRVSSTTKFNGTNLLDGSFTAKAFQVGANQGELINIDSIQNASIDVLGEWSSANRPAQAYGKDLGGAYVEGEGTATALVAGDITDATAKFDGFSISIGGSTVTVAGYDAGKHTTAADAAVDINNQIVNAINTVKSATGISAEIDALDIKLTNEFGSDTAVSSSGPVAIAGLNMTVDAAKKFDKIDDGDIKINGVSLGDIAASVSNTQRADQLAKAINNAFSDGSVKASTENGKLMLTSTKEIKIEVDAAVADGFGFADADTFTPTQGREMTGFADISVATAEGADDTILAMDAALKAVNSARADLGAIQNRFESVVSNLSVNSENLSASKSRIMDADFAAETANLSRSQILQQAGTAMVAQANQLPQGVLSLLR